MRIKNLNMQMKLVLCTLVVMKQRNSKDFSLGKVHETYICLCKFRNQVAPTQRSEFNDLVSMLEAQGLINLTSRKAKEDRNHKSVGLIVQTSEVIQAVSNVPILKSVMENANLALKN